MYDLAVIGAGWAGFNAALEAKESGLRVCLIDSGLIGGTCLNYGCIPTKTLIHCAKIFSLAKNSEQSGVQFDNLRLNFSRMQEEKDRIVSLMAKGMQSRLSGIDFINAPAEITSGRKLKADGRPIEAKFILFATGSRPLELPGLAFDGKKIISSDQALALSEIPQSLLIVGGGVIGCEFAGLFSALGSDVTIVEKLPRLLAQEDSELGRKIEVIFKKKGIKVDCGADVTGYDFNRYSRVLICVGRLANTSGLGLEELGQVVKDRRILTDEYLRLPVDNFYAAGDCTARVMLAHYAAYQGVAAVRNMLGGNQQKADNQIIPSCIFTEPQIASVGLSQDAAAASGLAVNVRKFDFRSNPMAHIIDQTEGFIKVIIDQKSDRVIGASIIGPQAAELIAVLAVAVNAQLTARQVSRMIFAHPTLSEGLRDAL